MFAIPFVFAFYPEILLIDQALIDPSSPNRAPLPGYENGVDLGALTWLLARLMLALYLVASALAAHDSRPLSVIWIVIRLAVALGVLMRPEAIQISAILLAVAILGWHHFGPRRLQSA